MRQREKDRLRTAVESAWAMKDQLEAAAAAALLLYKYVEAKKVADEYGPAVDRWHKRGWDIDSLRPASRNRAYRENDMRLLAAIGA